ncbi:MAG TPA: cystathionine beta-lyase [Hyphomicrobiaceae bacterium]|nr:cystathionine beta-lyase [Hyphomicrobiaceae bacterium]
MGKSKKRPQTLRTKLVQGGRPKENQYGRSRTVNTPIYRASTVLYENMAALRETRKQRTEGERAFSYGTSGTPTTFALEDVVTELEGGHATRLVSSGLLAITLAFQAVLRPGDHVLITDSTYEPVRNFVRTWLTPMGIAHDYFPADARGLEGMIRRNTKMIWTEIPGSHLFEMQDLPAICRMAKQRGILVGVDNTWASGILCQPLKLGADISILAGTKHIAGHADVLIGTVTTTESCWKPVNDMASALGLCISSDDAFLALRGVRTMATRLPVHQRSALELAGWLKKHPKVKSVFYPALPDDPGHEIWKRDFTGACGLFSIELKADQAGADRFVDGLTLFGIGASWGGFESLVMPSNIPGARTATDWSGRGPILRLHAGLEDPSDLIADLEAALALV